jgi:hypothetical protein
MADTDTFEPGLVTMTTAPDRLSLFQRAGDKVWYAMGTPPNIGVWIVIVVGWRLLFALHIVYASGTFLPGWSTSTGYNFPLHLVTTAAELYIRFAGRGLLQPVGAQPGGEARPHQYPGRPDQLGGGEAVRCVEQNALLTARSTR